MDDAEECPPELERDTLSASLNEIEQQLDQLAADYQNGRIIREGIRTVLLGRPNAGKSSVMNWLCGTDRSIVTDIAGTTRDIVTEQVKIGEYTLLLSDTAGLRETDHQIEQIGISRTYQTIDRARIILWIIDALPSTTEQEDIEARCQGKSLIIVCNKSDKGVTVANVTFNIRYSAFLQISAKTGQGIDELETAIYQAANIPDLSENDVIINNARHYEALQRAHTSIIHVLEGLHNELSADLLSEDLRQTLDILAEITGEQITPQETLNNIFQHFCVGK
jgi:tRNA modification GTPase